MTRDARGPVWQDPDGETTGSMGKEPQMRLARRRFALALAATALATTACGSATAPKWTFGAPATPPPAAGIDQPAGTPGSGTTAAAATVEVEAFDMGFSPAAITVPAAGTYEVSFANTGSTLHDLTFADGTVLTAGAGKTVTGQVTIPEGGLDYVCSIPATRPPG